MQELIEEFFKAPVLDRLVNFSFLAMTAGFLSWVLQRTLPHIKRIKVGTTEVDLTQNHPLRRATDHPPVPAPEPEKLAPLSVEPAPQPVAYQETKPSLFKHRIFLLEAEFLARIDSMDDGSAKAKVNVAFLKDCKFKSVYRHLRKFIENVEATTGGELDHFPILLHHIVKDYSELALRVEFRIGSRYICGVPVTYQQKFDRWHDPHLKYLLRASYEILRDSYYYSWWSTSTALLDLLLVVLHLTIDDAGNALAELNGELDREIAAAICRDQPQGE